MTGPPRQDPAALPDRPPEPGDPPRSPPPPPIRPESYRETPLAQLADAAAFACLTLSRLLETGELDKWDRATVRAVIGALHPAENPRLHARAAKTSAARGRRRV